MNDKEEKDGEWAVLEESFWTGYDWSSWRPINSGLTELMIEKAKTNHSTERGRARWRVIVMKFQLEKIIGK